MFEQMQPWHLVILSLAIFVVPAILYILTLQRALSKCAPESRTLEPVMVWLLIIPLVGVLFQFFLVIAMAKSLGNEFRRRALPLTDPEPGKKLGLATCICSVCTVIPIVGMLTGLVSVVLWFFYWVKISSYSRALDAPTVPSVPHTRVQ